jgi:DNA-binding NtrC family response regulator
MSKPRILLVEDSPYWQLAILKILERAGYDCDVESNTLGALSHLSWEDFDAVILDWELKIWTPESVEEYITKRNIPALYFTAHSRFEIQHKTKLPIVEKVGDSFSGLLLKLSEILEYKDEKILQYK